MQEKPRYTLQRTMILYFLLIGFASCMVGAEFLIDFHAGHDDPRVEERTAEHSQNQDNDSANIERMRKKAVVMVAIILVVTLIVLTMFIKNISEPLQHMIDNTRKILSGDLSRTVKIESDNELAELGNTINEISSNLQEVLLLCRGLCANGRKLTDETIRELQRGPLDARGQNQMVQRIQRLQGEFATMNQVVGDFDFYTGEGRHHVG